MSTPLPFTLRAGPPPVTGWRGRWEARSLYADVPGDAEAPSPPHLETLSALVAGFEALDRKLVAFLNALPPDHHVPLQSGNGGFAARSCGFAESLGYEYLFVTDPDPSRATLGFCTGLPDGYAMYEVELEAGRPVAVSAYAS